MSFGRLARKEKGGCPEYLSYVMEIGYLCRLRSIETITLTDAHELAEGITTNRRKGSRDNIVLWMPRLRAAWEGAKVWARKSTIVPIRPDRRYIIVAGHGGALPKSSLDTAWQRFITSAIEDDTIGAGAEQRFGLHDLKRRGITNTAGNLADKQEANGHRVGAMMDVLRPQRSPSQCFSDVTRV